MNSTALCGLVATRDAAIQQVPLTEVDVRVRIIGPTSRTTVRQRYENRESVPVEATYLFPLEDGSAVCGFAVTLDGHRLQGRVDERDAAFDAYDDAMSEGHAAFLLDQERPNLFTASVGNLLPGQVAEIELSYVSALPRSGEGFRFALPTGITPRYHGHVNSVEHMDDVERVTPLQTDGELGYSWNLVVEADLLGPIARLSSPTHRVVTTFEGDRARVELAADDRRPDRDFVLELVARDTRTQKGVTVPGPDGHRYGMIEVRTEPTKQRQNVEVLFVVDCSGSMYGDSIANARRTLQLGLRSLHPGDCFDIVRFGSSYVRCFGRPAEYDEESLARATRWVDTLDADLGGTEILAPLTEVLEAIPDAKHRARRIVLITDGAVSNEDEVLALCARHSASARIDAIGVGPAASESLVRGVARATHGAAEFVSSGEQIEDKVLRHIARLGGVHVEVLRLEGEGVSLPQPSPLPALDGMQPATLWFRIDAGDLREVTLHGSLAGEPWSRRVALDTLEESDGAAALLWARERIRELEDTRLSSARPGSNQQRRYRERQREAERRTLDELVALGTSFGLISSQTSYVIVDDRPGVAKATRPAELRQVASAMVAGTAMPWSSVVYAAGSPSASSAPDASSGAELGGFAFRRHGATPESDDPLLHQSADGSWTLTAWSARFTGVDVEQLRARGVDPDDDAAVRVAMTESVLAEIQRRGAAPDSWEPALEKARRWLARARASATLAAAPDRN